MLSLTNQSVVAYISLTTHVQPIVSSEGFVFQEDASDTVETGLFRGLTYKEWEESFMTAQNGILYRFSTLIRTLGRQRAACKKLTISMEATHANRTSNVSSRPQTDSSENH